MPTLQDIKKKYCLDEDVVNFMGHTLPRGIYTALDRLESRNTDQRQVGYFYDKEKKKKFINETNSFIRYLEQNWKKADPKEHNYIQKKINSLKKERDGVVSRLMVLK